MPDLPAEPAGEDLLALVAALRAANARLREVIEAKDALARGGRGCPVGPVKVQQRTSGGCRRTLDGLADFAIVQSCLSTAAKWGLTKLDALRKLFVTGPWLPPAVAPP